MVLILFTKIEKRNIMQVAWVRLNQVVCNKIQKKEIAQWKKGMKKEIIK